MESSLSVEELIREMDEPKLTGWKLFAQTSTVNVYRRTNGDNVKIYKVI
jgi:hypothetical protein